MRSITLFGWWFLFMFLLIAADIDVWLGNKQRSKDPPQSVIQFSRSTMFMLHLATNCIGHAHFIARYSVIYYVSVESRWKQRYTVWFQKESICAMWIILFVSCELSIFNIRNSSINSINRNNSECCLEVQLVTLLGEYGWDGIESNTVLI